MASRTAQPQPDLSRLILAASGGLALVGLLLGLPGAVLLVAGMFAAAFFTPPVPLTGKKDRAGRPTAAHQGESDGARWFRRMRDMRWRVLTPNADWLPSKDPRVSWLLGAGCAIALAAVGLPRLPQEWGWAPAANGLLAAISVWQFTGSGRRFASDYDPHPGIGVRSLARVKDLGKLAPVALGAAGAAAVVAGAGSWILIAAVGVPAGSLGPASPIAASVTLSLMAGLAVITGFVRSLIVTEWAELVAARLSWDQMWLNVGVKDDAPFLVEHRRIGPVTVDTFDAPASSGSAAFTQASVAGKIAVALGANMRSWAKSEPNIDSQGQPVPGSVHPLRFSVVYVPSDQMPNVTDVNLDPEAAQAIIEAAMGPACDMGGVSRYSLVQLEQIAQVDAPPAGPIEGEGAEGEEPLEATSPWRVWRSVWQNPHGLDGAYLRNAVRGYFSAQLSDGSVPVPVLVDHRAANGMGVVYIGYMTDGETVYDPASGVTTEAMVDVEREDAWRGRWGNVLKQGVNAPTPELSLFREEQLGGAGRRGATVRSQPFKTLQGDEPRGYFGLEDKIKATLSGAPFVAVTGFPGRGERPGERHSQAFCVYWSDQPVPDGPHSLPPTTSEAARWVLAGRMNEAFKAARLPQPEVAKVTCLTKQPSRGHIWKIEMRLYDGATLADVRAQRERIRGALGSAWLRVAEATDGCVIYAGAEPARVSLEEESTRALLVALDWEQAWLASKVTGEGGKLPKLTGVETLPHNTKVQVLDFDLPSGLSTSEVRAAVEKLKTATSNVYVDVLPGASGASSVRLLACEVNPLPEKAGYDFEVIDTMAGVLVFATGVDGEPIAFNPKVDPHLLVAGASGGGKSVTLQALIYGAVINGWDLYVADPTKSAADFQFAAPYAKAVAVDELSAATMMKAIYAEVTRRKDLNAKYGVGNYRDLPADVRPNHILLVIDEFTSLMGADPVPPSSDDPEMDAEREAILAKNRAKLETGVFTGKVAREARSAGVTLVLATQKLAAKMLDTIPGAGDLKVNLSRMLLGKATFGDKQSALRDPVNAPDLGAAIPPGRGLWETTEGQAKIMQSWYEPGGQAALSQMLAARVQPLADEDRLDLSAVTRREGKSTARAGKGAGAQVRTVTAEEVEVGDMELTWDDLADLGLDEGMSGAHDAEEHAVGDAASGELVDEAPDSADDDDDDDPDHLERPGLSLDEDEGPDGARERAQAGALPAPPAPTARATGWELPARPAPAVAAPPAVAAMPFVAPAPSAPPATAVGGGTGATALLLDIDGVLSPVRTPADPIEAAGAGGAMRVSRAMVAAIDELGVPLAWGSARTDDECAALAAASGLDVADGLRQSDGAGALGWWKLDALAAWLQRNPQAGKVAWVDDELATEDAIGISYSEMAADILDRAGVQHLLVSPDPEDGIGLAELAALATFFDVPAPAPPAPAADPTPAPARGTPGRALAYIPAQYMDDEF